MKKLILLPALFGAFLSVLPGADSAQSFHKRIPKDRQVQHALDRLTFGPRPGDSEAVRKMGVKKWVDQQLHPDRIAEDPVLDARLKPLETLSMTREELAKAESPRQGERELAEAKIYRAVYSRRQLQEVLTDFWYNHFNVFLDKGADRFLAGAYERDAIRPNIFGHFRELLEATAKSPAMLFYLDNWQSVAPRPGRARGLNENYARELMELHTLGVDGGYTQQDIIEVARCFTGWTIRQPRQGGGFEYNDKVHDKGAKTVLGVTIPAGGGMDDGQRVLDILARHPSTARFISRELAMRFVSDNPPAPLIARMVRTWTKTDGDLRAVTATLFDSPEFWSEGAYRAKVKTPFELTVSAVRAVNADVESATALANRMAQMGQPLYRKLEPTGYSSANAEWVSSSSLMARMNFALALAHNRIAGVKVDASRLPADPQGAAKALLGDLSPGTQAALEKACGGQVQLIGLALGSPDFQRR